MKTFSAKDAKQHFGELMDTVQREPVSIEKHGRPVAVMISNTEFNEMKLEGLRSALALGEAELDRGEYADYSLEKLRAKLDTEFGKKTDA